MIFDFRIFTLPTKRALVAVLCFSALCCGVFCGCDSSANKVQVQPPALVSYLPAGRSESASELLEKWANQRPPESVSADEPVNMLVIFQQAKTLEADIIRIEINLVLMTSENKAVKRDGRLWAVLGKKEGERYVPAGFWEFSPQELAGCFREGMISGYALDLRWPRVPDMSIYPLAFYWQATGDDPVRLASEIKLVDSIR